MAEPTNAFEYLEQLRKQNGKEMQNYTSLSRYLEDKARQKGVPVFGQFELTPLCNFSCKMCYVHLNADQLNGRKLLPVDTWKKLMHQAWEGGMMHVTLSGGECLTYPGFDEIYLYLHSLGCDVTVLTNGYLLDDKRIEFFKRHMISMIQITLYGWNDDVYERVTGRRAFHTVIENARKAIKAGLPVRLITTPNKFLGEDVMETVRLGKSIQRDFFVNSGLFPPREETGRSLQQDNLDADQYIRIYKLISELDGRELKEIDADKLPLAGGPSHECEERGLLCGAGRSGFSIDWKGTMIPCNRLEMVRAFPLEVGFKEAWAYINRIANNWPRVPECKGCAYQKVCITCAAEMLKYAEPGKQPVEHCNMTKYYVQCGVRRIAECEETSI